MNSEEVYSILNGLLVIGHWEVVAYALVITVFALFRLTEACLVNTFSFTFYWGFKGLLVSSSLSSSLALTDTLVALYVISGFTIFALLQLAYLKPNLASSLARVGLKHGPSPSPALGLSRP